MQQEAEHLSDFTAILILFELISLPILYSKVESPMRMLVVLDSFQNFQNGAVSNQLTEVDRGYGVCCG